MFVSLEERGVRELVVLCAVVDVDASVAPVELCAGVVDCVNVSTPASEIFNVVDSVCPAVAAVGRVLILDLLHLCFEQACIGGILVVTAKSFQIHDHGCKGSEAVANISPESSGIQVVIDPFAHHVSLDFMTVALFESCTGDGDKCIDDFLKFRRYKMEISDSRFFSFSF